MSSSIQFFYTFEPQFNSSTEDVSEHIQFDVLEFYLEEGVSQPYRLEAELISTDANIDFAKLLDTPACFTIWQTPPSSPDAGLLSSFGQNVLGQAADKALGVLDDKAGELANKHLPTLGDTLGSKLNDSLSSLGALGLDTAAFAQAKPMRRVHGVISDIALKKTGHRYTHYSIVMEPQLSRAMLSSDWKIFQQKTVPEIVSDVLKDNRVINFEMGQYKDHLQREYCVQADERNGSFIYRLLCEEGFVFTHLHTPEDHQLKITDSIYSFGAITINRDGTECQTDSDESVIVDPVLYNANPAGQSPYPSIFDFTYKEQVRTTRQVQRDYFFKNPNYSQEHSAVGRDITSQSAAYEMYDYPGRYKQDAAGNPFTQTRINALRNDAKIAIATSNDARIEPGIAFELQGHPRAELNQFWRPIKITHLGKQYTAAQTDAATTEQPTGYTQTAELVPATTDWKAPIPSKPLLHGPQIAIVTGPQNEEIYTDNWGRVKLFFPWDRHAQQDEHSSCWVRVAQGWGMGGGDGQQSIPRVGQEVLVAFMDSDPDQPIVVGRANNVLNPPPYELPKHKTRSTWRSKTHKGQGFNEIRFEDENQQEEIYIHAQKDQNIHVNHNETTFIGNDRTEHVEVNEKIFIGHDRQEQVIHDEAVEIGNDRKHHIINNEFVHIDQNQNIKIGDSRIETIYNHRKDEIAANHWVKIGGRFEAKVEGEHQIEAGTKIIRKTQVYELGVQDRIVFQSGGGKITLDSSGIKLEGNIQILGTMNQMGFGSSDPVSISGNPVDGILEECAEQNM